MSIVSVMFLMKEIPPIMAERSARDDLYLVIAELQGMLENVEFHLDERTGHRYNGLIERASRDLDDSLEHLKLEDEDSFIDSARRPKTVVMFDMFTFRSKARAALDYIQMRANRQPSVLEERYEVLATLVDAYLQNPSIFKVRWIAGEPSPRITHPGLDRRYSPPWSHIESLSHEGRLDLQSDGSGWRINVPTQVLEEYHLGAGLELSLPPGARRIEAIKQSPTTAYYVNNTTNVHGGQANIANSSSDFQQTSTTGLSSSDLLELSQSLTGMGVPFELVEELVGELKYSRDDETRRKSAWNWLTQLSGQVAAGTLGSSVADSLPQIVATVEGVLS